jgi:hypothetical protein
MLGLSFEENQNPVDMDTSIMCISILQNIKAVAPKLYEEIAGQTMYLYILLLSFFPWYMNLSMADLRNYWTEFHETWWSYRYI